MAIALAKRRTLVGSGSSFVAGLIMKSDAQDSEIIAFITDTFEEKIPFNKVIGLQIVALGDDSVKLKFAMQDQLIGNHVRGILHGGVISSAIDVTGGLAAIMGVWKRMQDATPRKMKSSVAKLGTIDLRVDYLRPGVGDWFFCTGYTLRDGSKVTVARIELHNDKNALIAVGTGSYVVA